MPDTVKGIVSSVDTRSRLQPPSLRVSAITAPRRTTSRKGRKGRKGRKMFEWLKPSSKETETEDEDANLQLSVAELELSVRSLNGLQNAKIGTIGDLIQWTEQGIMNLRFLGRKSVREIKQELARIGLTLKSPIGMITAGSQSQPDQIYGSALLDSLEEKTNVIEKTTNIIDRHESHITQLVVESQITERRVTELEGMVKKLEEEIKQVRKNFSLEWEKQYELGVELSNRYRELAGK